MLPLRTEFGSGYSESAPNENFYITGTVRSWRGDNPPLVYLHGSGNNASTMTTTAGQYALLRALSQRFLVIAADLGGEAWGNDTHMNRINDAIFYMRTRFGYGAEPVAFCAGSMGTLGALNYLRANPSQVKGVAAIIPALDLADLMLRGAAAGINAAYPPAYNDATMGPTHSPVKYAASLPSQTSKPIKLWTSSNDAITVPATADAFVAARPSTPRVNLGALGHTDAAVAAAVDSVMDFLIYEV